jgi:hypothetical protein
MVTDQWAAPGKGAVRHLASIAEIYSPRAARLFSLLLQHFG